MSGGEERLAEARRAVERWYRTRSVDGVDSSVPWMLEWMEDSSFWLSVDLAGTIVQGQRVGAFVLEIPPLGWLQGWSDGSTLSLAGSAGLVGSLAGLLAIVFGEGDRPGLGTSV